jgi:hypothetical protein
MTETALVAQDNRMLTFDEATRAAVAFAKSGFFKDASDAAQAVVKILAGQELGIGPVAAMRGISFIMGKLNLDAGLVSALIKRSGKYDYRIVTHTDKECELEFLSSGAPIGRAKFSMEDAKVAGLAGKEIWQKYPRNMLFARALSNGAKWFTPDVFFGSIYTGDEIDAAPTVPTIVEVAPPPTTKAAVPVEVPFTDNGGNGHKPAADPPVVDEANLSAVILAKAKANVVSMPGPMSEKQPKMLGWKVAGPFEEAGGDEVRHWYLSKLFGIDSFDKLTKAQASALIDVFVQREAEIPAYLAGVRKAWMKEQGFAELPGLDDGEPEA